jgi:hypothetical protein
MVKGYSQVKEKLGAVELVGYVEFSKLVIVMHRVESGSGRISFEFTKGDDKLVLNPVLEELESHHVYK